MKIYKSSKSNLIVDDAKLANSFISRTLGLLSKNLILQNEGLIIKPCCSIHTLFMKFDIDVLFVNRQNKVIAIYEKIRPYRVLPIHPTSFYVVELASGIISAKNIKKGDLLILE